MDRSDTTEPDPSRSPPGTSEKLAEHHRKLLEGDSAIPLCVAEVVGVRTVSSPTDLPADLAQYASELPGLVFPLPDIDGTVVHQLRPDKPSPDPSEPTRLRKYLLPTGSGSTITVHSAVADRVGAETTTTVLIVEGTKQTLAAVAHAPADTLVVGIQGCWGWSREGLPVGDLDRLGITGRKVIVAFDADRTDKVNVYDASQRLGAHVKALGASTVGFLSVPAGHSAKNGLDDYLAGSFSPSNRPTGLANLMRAANTKLGRRPAAPKQARVQHSVGEPFVDEVAGTIHLPDRADPITKQTLPGDVLLGTAPRIVETIVHLDDMDADYTFVEHLVEVPAGDEVHRVRVADRTLPDLGRWLERVPHGLGTHISRASGRLDEGRVANAIRTYRSDEVLISRRYPRTGWLVDGDRVVYLHAGGAIGPDGGITTVGSSLSGMSAKFALPDPTRDPDPAASMRASMAVVDQLLDPTPWFALMGGLAWAHMGLPPDTCLVLHGHGGAGKSSIAGAAAAHMAPLYGDGKTVMASLEGTPGAVAESGRGLHQSVVFVDDVHPETDERERHRQLKALDSLVRRSYSGATAGRRRLTWDRDSGRVGDAPVDQTFRLVVINGERLPTAVEMESTLQRMLAVEVTRESSWTKGTAQARRDGEKGLYQRALGGFLMWIGRQINNMAPEPGKAWDAWCAALTKWRSEVQAELKAGDLKGGRNVERASEVLAPYIMGLSKWAEYAGYCGAMDSEAADKWRDAAQRAVIAAMGVHTKEHLDEDAQPAEVVLDQLRSAQASGRAMLGDEAVPPGCDRLGRMTEVSVDGVTVQAVALLPNVAARVLRMPAAEVRRTLAGVVLRGADGKATRSVRVAGIPARCLCIPVDRWFLQTDDDAS